jgi:hypothetical protein
MKINEQAVREMMYDVWHDKHKIYNTIVLVQYVNKCIAEYKLNIATDE